MMRLQRVGRKNDPSFRVVVTDKRTGPKSNKHIDTLGSYDPKMNHVAIDTDKAKEWIAKGVQLSDTVHNILVGKKVIEGTKVNALPKKSPIVDESAAAEAAAPAPTDTSAPDEGAEETPAETTEEAPAEEPKEDAAAAEAPTEGPAADAKTDDDAADTTDAAEASTDESAESEEEKKS